MAVQTKTSNRSHMPKDSVLFEKVVPVLLVLFGLITFGLILFAAGIALGMIQF